MSTTKGARAALREAIREEITRSLNETGEIRPRTVTELIIAEVSDSVSNLGQELAFDAVLRMVSKEIKSWTAVRQAGADQPFLPGLDPEHVRELPATISVPEGHDVRHVALARCTVGQLRAYDRLLAKQIDDDMKKRLRIRTICDRVRYVPDAVPLSEALAVVEAAE